MRTSIVFKLFTLTTMLCLFILATIYLGQTIFFKQYYANRKVADIQANIQTYKKDFLNSGGDVLAIQKLEQDFYRQNNTWITTLDRYGNLKNVNDFYLEVKTDRIRNEPAFSNKIIIVPLYNMMNIEEVLNKGQNQLESLLKPDVHVFISEFKKDSVYIPYNLHSVNSGAAWTNKSIAEKIQELTLKTKYSEAAEYTEFPIRSLHGMITKVHLPSGNEASSFIYTNHLFMERIKQFQADLLFDENIDYSKQQQIIDMTQNDVKYKLFIDPIIAHDGETNYIISMASLQPVDEAVQMLEDYYVYLIVLVFLLIVLTSFYYSRKIARPLLQINESTKRIASLDFSESITIRSNDEIGDLSRSINSLSTTLHSYIEQLQKDIEKEKQLEGTRKEFISGVSHELKTPLSVMKSCISILKDGVATHKKEHYFKAMEIEVDRMDLLIVDMLELAKFESGTYNMKMEPFIIDRVIEQICEQLSVQISHKQLHLHTELATIEVMANQHRIEQVFTNFLTNAIRYTPEQEHIYISVREEEELIKVCIENKGAQIPSEQLDKVWDRFYRGDTARHRAKGGTGLGLAISKNILELHGVSYGAMNTDDGVLFYFYLNKA